MYSGENVHEHSSTTTIIYVRAPSLKANDFGVWWKEHVNLLMLIEFNWSEYRNSEANLMKERWRAELTFSLWISWIDTKTHSRSHTHARTSGIWLIIHKTPWCCLTITIMTSTSTEVWIQFTLYLPRLFFVFISVKICAPFLVFAMSFLFYSSVAHCLLQSFCLFRTSFNQRFWCSKCHFTSNQQQAAIKWYLCILPKWQSVCMNANANSNVCTLTTDTETMTAGKVGVE